MKETITYLTFDGNCRQAMEFYKKCLDAELHMMTFAEIPGDIPAEAKQAKDRIMHAKLTKPSNSTVLMASDTMPGMAFKQGNNFSISVNCESVEEVEKLFAALSEQGKVTMPVQDTFWGARFGMLTDQFGINWMFNFDYPKEA